MTLHDTVKRILKDRLTPVQWERFRKRYIYFRGQFLSKDLAALATLHCTDKWNLHWYAQHYQCHFLPLRHKSINLLEIGVGGYGNSDAGGASLRMWKQFFPKGNIYGIDIYDKSSLQEPRITIFRGSQDDPEFLQDVTRRIGRIDIVVDDGSHINEHVLRTFETLFPLLVAGGIYAIEDTQTSYWPKFGGSEDVSHPATMMNRLKRLADGLNYKDFLDPSYSPTYFDRHVTSVHFYHNLTMVYKGLNEEGSIRAVFDDPTTQWKAAVPDLVNDLQKGRSRAGASAARRPDRGDRGS